MTRPWLLVASAGFTVGALFGWPGAIAIVAAATVISAATRDRWLPIVLAVGLFAVLGVGRAAMHHPEVIGDAVLASDRAEGIVAGQPQVGPSGERAVVQVERVRQGDGEWVEADGRVLVFFRDSSRVGITGG